MEIETEWRASPIAYKCDVFPTSFFIKVVVLMCIVRMPKPLLAQRRLGANSEGGNKVTNSRLLPMYDPYFFTTSIDQTRQ